MTGLLLGDGVLVWDVIGVGLGSGMIAVEQAGRVWESEATCRWDVKGRLHPTVWCWDGWAPMDFVGLACCALR